MLTVVLHSACKYFEIFQDRFFIGHVPPNASKDDQNVLTVNLTKIVTSGLETNFNKNHSNNCENFKAT